MKTFNPKYNLIVSIGGKKVLRTEDTFLNRLQIKQLFEGENYKLMTL